MKWGDLKAETVLETRAERSSDGRNGTSSAREQKETDYYFCTNHHSFDRDEIGAPFEDGTGLPKKYLCPYDDSLLNYGFAPNFDVQQPIDDHKSNSKYLKIYVTYKIMGILDGSAPGLNTIFIEKSYFNTARTYEKEQLVKQAARAQIHPAAKILGNHKITVRLEDTVNAEFVNKTMETRNVKWRAK